ncbi:MAG: NAD-dependent DNA ligase, partial [Harvfovirus sp.]
MNETWNKKTFKEKIIEVEGFSDITADKIIENFKAFKELFDQINKIIDISHLSKVHEDVPAAAAQCAELEGKTIVFTGFRDKDLEKMVKICKGKVTTS